MYNRYGDISKFIIDMEQLCIADDGYVCLPSPIGVLRFDCSQSMENNPDPQEKEFPFELGIICLEAPDRIVFDYWGTAENTQLEAAFEYKDRHFFLRKFGAFDCIPDNWEESE